MRGKTTHRAEFIGKLTESFGADYTTVILLAARLRKTADFLGEHLDTSDKDTVTEHLAALHRLDGVRQAAREILRTTRPATGTQDTVLTERLPDDHITTMIDCLTADFETPPQTHT